jgi:ATP-dependent helicase HepA
MPDIIGKRKNPENPTFAVGQRWMSEMEPELGLGKVSSIDFRRITIDFHNGETKRIYTKENAPLKRIIFKTGDSIKLEDGSSGHVTSVDNQSAIVIYNVGSKVFDETKLSYDNKITAPLDRLLASHVDTLDDFKLRAETLKLRNKIVESEVRGFIGGRIELIPHQLYIAKEVTARHVRRIMLADEVGLGKTIEACMILHRLIVSGRANQVLVVVPESMVHVWFVELLRKFNLLFTIIKQPDYADEELPDNSNLFSDTSLNLISLNYLVNCEEVTRKAIETSWDLIIVDEAHHLIENTPPFEIIKLLSQKTRDILLLTATPQHYGEMYHFARLKILDPARYSDFDLFCKEAGEHKKIAGITGKILDGTPLSKIEIDEITPLLSEELAAKSFTKSGELTSDERKQSVAELIDRQGIGRALFRNTRVVIGGFPKREVTVKFFDADSAVCQNAVSYFQEDKSNSINTKKRIFTKDPRVSYLAELLRQHENDKFLIICRCKESAIALGDALQKVINVNTALFHEELTLLQRDRNAAWFAEDEGARILICSEIGSEGRNFQFSHRIFLFDLPPNPELVEQRIGRLDRIGQKNTVSIYVPALNNTPDYFFAEWFHKGLGIFSETVSAAQEVFDMHSKEVENILHNKQYQLRDFNVVLDSLIQDTRQAIVEVTERLQNGRDRLLEQHSFRPKEAHEVIQSIESLDNDEQLRVTFSKLLRSYGIMADQFQADTWQLLSEDQLDESFPGLTSSRSIITFNRKKALHREDYEFITIDHPAVTGSVDLFLSSEKGNATFAIHPFNHNTELLIEVLFTAECIAPHSLFINRFFSPGLYSVTIDNKLTVRTSTLSKVWLDQLESTPELPILNREEVKRKLIPQMLKIAESEASKWCKEVIDNSLIKINNITGAEVARLKDLKKVNSSITDHEISLAEQELKVLQDTVIKASPTIDALKLIWCPGKNRA